ncbi:MULTISPECIES: hypothetical protein [unclassified Massilia]|uniref:hypothetical protein n=1 Tax=unclassified Massilia TaxID=2609279 RepID=UPI001B8286FB|nr:MULTISPECIES: hypothetical protein [unclassified Massilia]MBQ5939973.1 hypothetical protein [Massilia sp. AB1]MBQ5964270.1 hypothetical protein [Massilia sp. ZL223]
MMPTQNNDLLQLRAEIALTAARMIAQDGADYATARRKAARQVLGVDDPKPNMMPDDGQIEDEVRKYLALFGGPEHGERLGSLRATALQVMDALSEFRPYLTGAVLNGTAGEHDAIHLQLFADSAKEVEIYLLNRNVNIEISETPHFKGGRHAPVETVSFTWGKEDVHAELYEFHDLRGALKPRADGRLQRVDADGLRALLKTDGNTDETLEQDE